MNSVKLRDCVEILDKKRFPLSAKQRMNMDKNYPYYGAQGIVDYVDDYIFDGEFILVAEDGNNLKTLKESIFNWATGKFWVNNHAHVLGSKEGYNLKFIYYLLCTMDLRKYLTGSAQPKLNQANLGNVDLYVPDKTVQDRIAELLSIIDNKIDNNNIIAVELDSIKKTTFNYWFMQYNFPDLSGKPYQENGGPMVWDEKLKRSVPEKWKIDKLGNTFTSNRGISYDSSAIEGEGIPMINLASFCTDGSYKIEGLKQYSGTYAADKVLKAFDLVMCNTQQTAIDYKKDIIGKPLLIPNIFEGDIVSSHHVTSIKPYNEDMKYYLYMLFNTDFFHQYAAGYANGTNILGLIFSGIEEYVTEIPDDNVLKKFAIIMKDIEEKKSQIIKENQELTSLRDFLLPLLINGQIKFNN